MRIDSLLAAALVAASLAACAPKENATPADSAAGAASSVAGAPLPTAADDTMAASAGASPGGAGGAGGALLDPNAATREQIAALPGMDAALADSLVAKRPFPDMRAVDRVLATRLGATQRDTIYARMFLPLDLNAATREEIELIPGVGARMRHEFEEYRPYRDMARFRREIGKYVDSAEVARLERYVRIP